jgi:hypothetical protein
MQRGATDGRDAARPYRVGLCRAAPVPCRLLVAQVSNLLYRRLPVGETADGQWARRPKAPASRPACAKRSRQAGALHALRKVGRRCVGAAHTAAAQRGPTARQRLDCGRLRPLFPASHRTFGIRLRYPASGIRHPASVFPRLTPHSSLLTSDSVGRRCVGAAHTAAAQRGPTCVVAAIGRGPRRCWARRSLAPPEIAPAGTQPGPTRSDCAAPPRGPAADPDSGSPRARVPPTAPSPSAP